MKKKNYKKTILFGLSAFLVIILTTNNIGTVYAQPGIELTIDQINDVITGTSYGTWIGGWSLFQSFVPDTSSLDAVDLRLRAGGLFPDEGYHTQIRIRAYTPFGMVLGNAVVFIPGPIITGHQVEVRFEFSEAISLIPGVTYVIEWITPLEGGIYLTWMGAGNNPYPSGNAFSPFGIPKMDVDFIFTTYTLVDITPPSISLETPLEGQALQDIITFKITATDFSEVTWVTVTITDFEGNQVAVSAISTSNDEWELAFDTTELPDGYYQINVEASDEFGNIGSLPEPILVSIRNWAVLELLPETERHRAGRTMPVKFSLRVAEIVDPAMPFVRNEELRILIYDSEEPGVILQESFYGDTSKDYRTDSTTLYITNFRTSKIPKTYVVEVWRGYNMLIDSFEFSTYQ